MILRCIVERMQIKQSKGGRDVSDWVGDFQKIGKDLMHRFNQPAGARFRTSADDHNSATIGSRRDSKATATEAQPTMRPEKKQCLRGDGSLRAEIPDQRGFQAWR